MELEVGPLRLHVIQARAERRGLMSMLVWRIRRSLVSRSRSDSCFDLEESVDRQYGVRTVLIVEMSVRKGAVLDEGKLKSKNLGGTYAVSPSVHVHPCRVARYVGPIDLRLSAPGPASIRLPLGLDLL